MAKTQEFIPDIQVPKAGGLVLIPRKFFVEKINTSDVNYLGGDKKKLMRTGSNLGAMDDMANVNNGFSKP